MATLTVISNSDFLWFKALDGPRWMRKRPYKNRQKQTYYRALDDQVNMLANFGYHDPLDGPTLRQLLAVVISKDGTFGPFFHDQGAQDLQNEPGWERLYSVCAGRVVEKYLEQRKAPAPKGPGYLLSESVVSSINELLEHAVAAGALSAQQGKEAGEDFLVPPGKPEILEHAQGELEELLATDVNLAVEIEEEEGADIPKREREAEITKSALLRLRVRDLRKIAEQEDLPQLRDKEALASVIVRRYAADRHAIANLVLSKLGDNPETGHSTHLLPLTEPPHLGTARERLLELRGHYLRIEVAHWLVFSDSSEQGGTIRFGGELRYYDVAAQREGGEAEIAARQRRAAVEVRLRDGVRWAEVDGRNLTEIRRMRTVFGKALGVRTEPYLPLIMPALGGEAATLDRNTLLMLRILETGLRDQFIDYASFTAAEFTKPQATVTEADPMRPTVRQVKLSGQHILSSTDACRLIAGEGQRMTTVEFKARFRESLEGQSHFSNVKISLATDQATVMTSYGGNSKISGRLHKEIVKRLRKALDRGVKDDVELDSIVRQIVARAGETGEVETVDILGPADGQQIEAGKNADGNDPGSPQPVDRASSSNAIGGDAPVEPGARASESEGSEEQTP